MSDPGPSHGGSSRTPDSASISVEELEFPYALMAGVAWARLNKLCEMVYCGKATESEVEELTGILQQDELCYDNTLIYYVRKTADNKQALVDGCRRLRNVFDTCDCRIKQAALTAQRQLATRPRRGNESEENLCSAVARERDLLVAQVARLAASEMQQRLFGRRMQKDPKFRHLAMVRGRQYRRANAYYALAHLKLVTAKYAGAEIADTLFPEDERLREIIVGELGRLRAKETWKGFENLRISEFVSTRSPTTRAARAAGPSDEACGRSAQNDSPLGASAEDSARGSMHESGVRADKNRPQPEDPSAPSSASSTEPRKRVCNPGNLISLVASEQATEEQLRLFRSKVGKDNKFRSLVCERQEVFRRTLANKKRQVLQAELKKALDQTERRQTATEKQESPGRRSHRTSTTSSASESPARTPAASSTRRSSQQPDQLNKLEALGATGSDHPARAAGMSAESPTSTGAASSSSIGLPAVQAGSQSALPVSTAAPHSSNIPSTANKGGRACEAEAPDATSATASLPRHGRLKQGTLDQFLRPT